MRWSGFRLTEDNGCEGKRKEGEGLSWKVIAEFIGNALPCNVLALTHPIQLDMAVAL